MMLSYLPQDSAGYHCATGYLRTFPGDVVLSAFFITANEMEHVEKIPGYDKYDEVHVSLSSSYDRHNDDDDKVDLLFVCYNE